MLSRLAVAVRSSSTVRSRPVVAAAVARPVAIAWKPVAAVKAVRSFGAAAAGTADSHTHHHYVWSSGKRTAEEGDWVIDVPADPLAVAEAQLMGETICIPPLHETLEWPLSTPMDFHTYEETPAIKETIVPGSSHDSKHEE